MKKIFILGFILILCSMSVFAQQNVINCNGNNCNGKDYQINSGSDLEFKKNDMCGGIIKAYEKCGNIQTINVTFMDEQYNNYAPDVIKTPYGDISNPAVVFCSYKIILSDNNCIDYYFNYDRDSSYLNLTYIYGLNGWVRFESTIANKWLGFLNGYIEDVTKGYPINTWVDLGLSKYSIWGYDSLNAINLLSGTLNIGDTTNITNVINVLSEIYPQVNWNSIINNTINNNYNFTNNYQILNDNAISVNIGGNNYTISNNPINNITTINYNGINISFDNTNNNYNNNTNVNNIFVNASGVYYLDNQVFINQTSIIYNSFDNPITIPLSIFENITRNDNLTYILEIKDGAFSITPTFTNSVTNQYNNQYNTTVINQNPDYIESCNQMMKDKNILFYVIIGVLTLIIIVLLITKGKAKKEPNDEDIEDYPPIKPRKRAAGYEETDGIPTLEKPFDSDNELEDVSIDELRNMRKKLTNLKKK